jgi:hypothetical protein
MDRFRIECAVVPGRPSSQAKIALGPRPLLQRSPFDSSRAMLRPSVRITTKPFKADAHFGTPGLSVGPCDGQ